MEQNITVLDAETLNDDLRRVLLPVTVYVGVEAVLGMFGNLLVLFVFKFRYHICNFRYFVLCLALTDVIASSTAISGEVVTQLFWYIYPFPIICKIKSFFNVFTVFAEAMCLLTIAVDRYRKVCRPLAWQIKPRNALYLCAIIYCLSAVIAFPVAIFWGVHNREINKKDIEDIGSGNSGNIRINVTICEIDQKYLGMNQPQAYTYSLETIISFSLVPMFILYILVAKTLVGSSNLQKKQSQKRKVSTLKVPKRYDDKSDTDYKTDDDSDSSFGHVLAGATARKVLPPIRKGIVKLGDVELDESTGNSMSTTQTGVNLSDTQSPDNNSNEKRKSVRNEKRAVSSRVRRKTLIMFILTLVFIITTITYLTMLGFIAGDVLESLSHSEKAVYFFFFRFYFINHVINPVVYGLLDPQFRKVMKGLARKLRCACTE